MSGLNQRFTKPPTGKTVREFESHILRKTKTSHCLSVRFCVSSGDRMRDSKDGKRLWESLLSQGREYLVECEWNETLY